MTIFEKLVGIAAKHAPAEKPPEIVAKKGDEATLYLYDAITPPGYGGISAQDVCAALDKCKDAKSLHLRINSPGGAVYEAKAIYAALKAHPAHKTAHVDGLAASAATFIAMAADRICTAPEATWFIHGAQGMTMGDAAAHRDTADLLEMESDNIRAIYAKRTGQKDETLRAMMDAETFMTAAEAKALGFTDEIEGEEKKHKCAASELPRIFSLARETAQRVAEPEAKSRLVAYREQRIAALKSQQDRSRASASSAPGQPGKR